MDGNQGLEALVAAASTENGSNAHDKQGAAAVPNSSAISSDPAAAARQWQQAMIALNHQNSGGAAGASSNLQQSLSLLQAAGISVPSLTSAMQTSHAPPSMDLMQSLAYLRQLQEQQGASGAAAATNLSSLNPLLFSNQHALALALAGQAQQLQQQLGGQQVLPPVAASAPTGQSASDTSQSMPPPPRAQAAISLPSTLSTAGIGAGSSPRHAAIAPLPQNNHSNDATAFADGSPGLMEDKKLQKRAANRRSAQLSRKRKKQFIEELKDENDDLRRKEQILKSIPDLIVVFDSTGKLWFVSQSASRFLKLQASELEGTSFWDRLCEDSVRLLKAAFMDSLAARQDDSDTAPLGSGIWELRLVDKDGTHKVVTLNGVVHFSGDRPECVCSIRPLDAFSQLAKRKQRKTTGSETTEEGKTQAAGAVPGVASVSTSNGSDGTASSGNDSGGNDSSESGSSFQLLSRANPQQSVIAGLNRKGDTVGTGKRREAARISDGDSGSTDTDSGSSDELGEEIATN